MIATRSSLRSRSIAIATMRYGPASFQLLGSTRRAALTSRSDGCHDTPTSGVEMPVSRFAISENFTMFIPSQAQGFISTGVPTGTNGQISSIPELVTEMHPTAQLTCRWSDPTQAYLDSRPWILKYRLRNI